MWNVGVGVGRKCTNGWQAIFVREIFTTEGAEEMQRARREPLDRVEKEAEKPHVSRIDT